MAKPISFTKRDLEKKKQEKRLAKQQKYGIMVITVV